ncbi:MAG: GntR family transcriptional regulator [Deltaproteobacteria bacterium]|nr:GntR family transcriptional regulator [Deltaproteobacteria bacterium]
MSNASSHIYERLKEDIIDLKYRFGQKIVDNEIASQFGVSRTPIRETLSKLERDGFVKKIPNVGYFINRISIQDIKDLYFVRGIIELEGVKLALKNMDEEKIISLEKIVRNSRKLLEAKNLTEYAKASWQMHRTFVLYGENRLLYQMFNAMSEKLIMAANIGFREQKRLFKGQNDHETIIAYLKKNKWKELIRFLKKHIKEAEKNTIETIMSNPANIFC